MSRLTYRVVSVGVVTSVGVGIITCRIFGMLHRVKESPSKNDQSTMGVDEGFFNMRFCYHASIDTKINIRCTNHYKTKHKIIHSV